MTWDVLGRQEWREWLLEVAGGNPVRPGAKLDPFGTSWRVFSTQARRWLPRIKAGEAIGGSQRRADQALIDLRAAHLVQAETHELTELGEALLDRWDALPDQWAYELPMGVALLQEAVVASDGGFKDMLAFWWDIRARFDDDVLLADREAVLLLPYLNQTVGGFNPWVALRESEEPIPLPVPWSQLKQMVPSRSKDTNAAVGRLQDRLDPSRRLAGRVVFCRAMSLLFERHQTATMVPTYLDGLELPYRSER
jgi:hypothetical protein